MDQHLDRLVVSQTQESLVAHGQGVICWGFQQGLPEGLRVILIEV